jgi:hypothetical protein
MISQQLKNKNMISYWFHNITKGIYNESHLDDFIECIDDGDIIKFTENGNALIRDLFEITKYEDISEHKNIREEIFKKYRFYVDNKK